MTNKFIYIVFASLLSVIIVSCNLLYREVKKRDYIFPENYEGWAAVVFDCKNGVSREEIGEREQLIIPMNGILLCSFKRSKGGIDPNIFILDKTNSGPHIPLKRRLIVMTANDALFYFIFIFCCFVFVFFVLFFVFCLFLLLLFFFCFFLFFCCFF